MILLPAIRQVNDSSVFSLWHIFLVFAFPTLLAPTMTLHFLSSPETCSLSPCCSGLTAFVYLPCWLLQLTICTFFRIFQHRTDLTHRLLHNLSVICVNGALLNSLKSQILIRFTLNTRALIHWNKHPSKERRDSQIAWQLMQL